MFCQPNGYFWSPNNIGLRVKELLVKAGLEAFSLHGLRRSHASIQLSNGTPLEVVSKRLGHANSNITLAVYSHALSSLNPIVGSDASPFAYHPCFHRARRMRSIASAVFGPVLIPPWFLHRIRSLFALPMAEAMRKRLN